MIGRRALIWKAAPNESLVIGVVMAVSSFGEEADDEDGEDLERTT